MVDRGKLTWQGYAPICPVCDSPVDAPDMHEVLLTRGDVQGLDTDLQMLIFDRHNCVLVHQECHDHSIKDVCVKHLIEKEGCSHIMSWLGLWDGILSDAMVRERMNRVEGLYRE